MKRYIVVATLVVALVAVLAAFAIVPAAHSSAQAESGPMLAMHTLYLDANYTPPICPAPMGSGCDGGSVGGG